MQICRLNTSEGLWLFSHSAYTVSLRRSIVKVLYYLAQYWGLAHVMWVMVTSSWHLIFMADIVVVTRFTSTGMIYLVDTASFHNIFLQLALWLTHLWRYVSPASFWLSSAKWVIDVRPGDSLIASFTSHLAFSCKALLWINVMWECVTHAWCMCMPVDNIWQDWSHHFHSRDQSYLHSSYLRIVWTEQKRWSGSVTIVGI